MKLAVPPAARLVAPLARSAPAPAVWALAVAATALVLACAPGGDLRVQLIEMDRPGDDVGLRPPADYKACYDGEARGYDTNGDGKVDEVRVSSNGKDRCYGADQNHDGKIDTWDVMDDSGNVLRRAHDSNGDGRVDQVWTFDPARHGCATVARDENADGKPDPGSPVDICGSLTSSAAPAAPPPPR